MQLEANVFKRCFMRHFALLFLLSVVQQKIQSHQVFVLPKPLMFFVFFCSFAGCPDFFYFPGVDENIVFLILLKTRLRRPGGNMSTGQLLGLWLKLGYWDTEPEFGILLFWNRDIWISPFWNQDIWDCRLLFQACLDNLLYARIFLK